MPFSFHFHRCRYTAGQYFVLGWRAGPGGGRKWECRLSAGSGSRYQPAVVVVAVCLGLVPSVWPLVLRHFKCPLMVMAGGDIGDGGHGWY